MRLVICDDHQLLLEALAIALHSQGHDVVAAVTSPEGAVEAVRQHQPDICLLDVSFPGENSLGAISRIRAAGVGHTRVVMLSATQDASHVARALAEGAVGFVGKAQPIAEITAALNRTMDGQIAVDPELLQRALRPSEQAEDPLWVLRFLTEREWEVMRCIMEGLSTEQMAQVLGVQRSTARTHVQNLLTKLGVHSRLQAAALMTAHATQETWPVHMR
jgi:two-component system nitrate/nitrite response regulator NarL